MYRSEINRAIDRAVAFFHTCRFPLPPFAYWSPEAWACRGEEYHEIRSMRLGWDVTDFGSGNFPATGRTIFTLRNGSVHRAGVGKTYAHKAMFLREGQRSPIHFHQRKMEDIVNQGGGNILITLWRADATDAQSPDPFTLQVDGCARRITSGATLRLTPGESVCIVPRTYHQFWAEEGAGATLSVEVSSVCDDLTDNFWLHPHERFPGIVEDEPARYCLCHEYPAAACILTSTSDAEA
ncbi:MAG: hypothetical protein BWY76_00327 [bacterium ADurb.Bin429]|nr:MAG: hypothetical protein BWY76_00327 [bacterium ADurb.Bin429]